MSRVLDEAMYNQDRVLRMLLDYRDAEIDVKGQLVEKLTELCDRATKFYADLVRLQMIVQARDRKAS